MNFEFSQKLLYKAKELSDEINKLNQKNIITGDEWRNEETNNWKALNDGLKENVIKHWRTNQNVIKRNAIIGKRNKKSGACKIVESCQGIRSSNEWENKQIKKLKKQKTEQIWNMKK